MLRDFVAVCAVGVVESVTLAVKLVAPNTVGVPVIAPVDRFKVSPAGSDPELIDHAYGVVPPVAVRLAV